MKCKSCDRKFFSLEWYEAETQGLILCDECVLYIYKTRKEIKQNEIKSIDRKISELTELLEYKHVDDDCDFSELEHNCCDCEFTYDGGDCDNCEM